MWAIQKQQILTHKAVREGVNLVLARARQDISTPPAILSPPPHPTPAQQKEWYRSGTRSSVGSHPVPRSPPFTTQDSRADEVLRFPNFHLDHIPCYCVCAVSFLKFPSASLSVCLFRLVLPSAFVIQQNVTFENEVTSTDPSGKHKAWVLLKYSVSVITNAVMEYKVKLIILLLIAIKMKAESGKLYKKVIWLH